MARAGRLERIDRRLPKAAGAAAVARRIGAALVLACSAAPVLAEENGQLWAGVVATGPVRGDLGLLLYGEVRFGDDISRMSQSVFAAGLGWERGRGRSLYGGYLMVNTYPRGGRAPREHRLWQQAAYPLGSVGAFRLTGRSLAEQRRFEGFRETGWRLQQNIRATVPVTRNDRVRAVAYADLLVNLNDTDWGARSGLDQARLFGGLNILLPGSRALEIGYFHQHIVRRGREDRVNHVALVTLFQRLGR